MDRRPTARTPRDPVLVALVVLILVALSGFAVRRAPTGPQVAVFWLLMVAAQTCFAVSSWRVARALPPGSARSRAARRMWLPFAAGGAVMVLGNVVQLGVVTRDATSFAAVAGSDAQTGSVAIGLTLIIAGLLRYPVGCMSGAARVRLRIDLATVLAAATTVGLWVFQAPAGPHDPAWALRTAVALLIEPGLFLVAVFAVVRMVLADRSPFTPATGIIFAAAAVLQAPLQAAPMSFYLDPAFMPWLFAGNVAGSSLIAIGARVQERRLRAGGGRHGRPDAERPYSPLPYVAMGVVWAVTLAVLAISGLTGRSALLIGGALVTTALVTARQAAAFKHIAELLHERDALTRKLTELAYHDGLTKLANRGLFLRRLHEALAAGSVTVFLIDLDDFKPVNDGFGHATGDQLLIEVATRLRAGVRTGDLVARLGGDEFAVMVQNLPPERRDGVAGALSRALHDTVRIGGRVIVLSASIGMATGRHGTHDPDSLLHEADMAMYAAKETRSAAGVT
ncbi:GGDEF domain-containing protein [Actinoplanes sp. N902-109]|uniref:GGDEF domain-containing protein n=1 Tax=Actinoplanes sp. (strain N902-109) TaxID=649831 RepID=UPI0012FBB090|nr:GGDEF domain-containing protein [Actinoplanes sp. N902-109]